MEWPWWLLPAIVLALATSLMRPEAWPFLGVYAIWLWLQDPSFRAPWRRAVIVVGLLSVPFFWFVPPWVGSGDVMRGIEGVNSEVISALLSCGQWTGHTRHSRTNAMQNGYPEHATLCPGRKMALPAGWRFLYSPPPPARPTR